MKRDWKKTRYRTRIKEYLYLANKLKRNNCKVILSSIGPYATNKKEHGDNNPFDVIYHWKSTGEMLPTNNTPFPEWLLIPFPEWLLIGKAARDWHITEWGQAMTQRIITPNELLLDGVPPTLIESAKKDETLLFNT